MSRPFRLAQQRVPRFALLASLVCILVLPAGAAAAPPDLQGRPAVKGIGQVGVDLRATAPANTGGTGTVTWRWERQAPFFGNQFTPIPGATESHYTLQPEDANKVVKAIVTVANGDGTDTEESRTIAVQEIRPGNGKVMTFRQGPRFNAQETSGPEISDLTKDGRYLVSTDYEVVDLQDLSDGKFLAPLPQTSNGAVSVSFAKDDKYVLMAEQTPGDTTDTVFVIDFQTRDIVRAIPVPDGIDSVNVGPSGNYALAIIEGEPEESRGQIAIIDTRAEDPDQWDVTPVQIEDNVPGDGGLVTDDPQPENASIRADDVAAVTVQEDNAVAIVDLPTATVTDLWSMGSLDNLADLENDGNLVFDDPYNPSSVADNDPRGGLGAEREPDSIAWIGGGTKLAIAEEGEFNLNGGRGWSVWEPDGDLVWETKQSLDELMAQFNLATDGRATSRGNEFEGLTAATFDGREYIFTGSERAFALAAYDVTNPESPRFVTAIPTGREPEGIVANAQREIVITSNENGNADAWTVIEGISENEIDPDRRPVVGETGAYRLSLEKLGAAGGTKLVGTLDNFRIATLRLDSKDRVRLSRMDTKISGVRRSGGTYADVAVDPRGGWWVVEGSQLRHVAPDGEVGPNVVSGAGTQVGVAVSKDGAKVYITTSGRAIRTYDVDAGTLSAAVTVPVPAGLPSFTLNDMDRTADGRLFLYANNVSSTTAAATVAVPVVGPPAPTPEIVFSNQPRSNRGVAGNRNGAAVLPNGDVWTTASEVEGSAQRSTHLQRYPRAVAAQPPADPAPGTRLPGPTASALPGGPKGQNFGGGLAGAARVGDDLLVAGAATAFGEDVNGAAYVQRGPDGLTVTPLPGSINSPILDSAQDAEGRLYVVGEFTDINNTPRNRVARILPDGTLDPTFAPNVNSSVRAVEVIGDLVAIGGGFSRVGSMVTGGLAVLNKSDGSLALTTQPSMGTASEFNMFVSTLLRASDGDLLVIGDISQVGGTPVEDVVRLDVSNPAAWTNDAGFVAQAGPPPSGTNTIEDAVIQGTSLWVIRNGQSGVQRMVLATGADDPAVEHPAISDGAAAITTDGTRVFAAWDNGREDVTNRGVIAFDATSGQIVDGFDPAGANTKDRFGRNDLDVIDGDLLLANRDGITALDPATGAVRPARSIGASGEVSAVDQYGAKIFLGGRMTGVGEPIGPLFLVDSATGKLDRTFNPDLRLTPQQPVAQDLAVDGDRAAVNIGDSGGAVGIGIVDLNSGDVIGGLEDVLNFDERPNELYLAGDTLLIATPDRVIAMDTRTQRRDAARSIAAQGVQSFARLPGNKVLVAGDFTTVDGVARPGLAKFDLDTGELVDEFDPPVGGTAVAASAGGAAVYVGGEFGDAGAVASSMVAKLDPETGAPDSGFTAKLAGGASRSVDRMALAMGRLIVNGDFATADGVARPDLVALDPQTGRPRASWRPPTTSQIAAFVPIGADLWIAGAFEQWNDGPGERALVKLSPEAASNDALPAVLTGSGGPRDGDDLTCDPGRWGGDPDLAFRWLAGGNPIGGATGSTYAPTLAQIGAGIACEVKGTNELGNQTVTSATVTVTGGVPRNTALPGITGTRAAGQTLTATNGTWDRTVNTFGYEWFVDGDTTGIVTQTYVVQPGDAGKEVTVRVTATGAGGASAPAESAVAPIAVVPSTSGTPTISPASPVVGQPLTANEGTWAGNPAFLYQWLRDGAAIGSATARTYTPVDADEGHALAVRVIGRTAAGDSAPVTSAPVNVPLPDAPVATARPVVSGSGIVGADVTCEPATFTGKGPITITMRWLRGGTPVAGAGARTYRLTEADIGRAVTCEERATNKGGTTTAESFGVVPEQKVEPPAVEVQPPPATQVPAPVVNLTAPLSQDVLDRIMGAQSPETIRATQVVLDPPASAKRGKKVKIAVGYDRPLRSVKLLLRRGGQTYASASAASLPGTDGSLTLTLSKKLKKGEYSLKLTARDSLGRLVVASETLAVK